MLWQWTGVVGFKKCSPVTIEKKNSNNNLRKMFLFSAARSKKPPTERYRHISGRLQPYTYRRYDRLNTNFLSVPVGFCDRGMRRYCRFCDTEKTPRVCFLSWAHPRVTVPPGWKGEIWKFSTGNDETTSGPGFKLEFNIIGRGSGETGSFTLSSAKVMPVGFFSRFARYKLSRIGYHKSKWPAARTRIEMGPTYRSSRLCTLYYYAATVRQPKSCQNPQHLLLNNPQKTPTKSWCSIAPYMDGVCWSLYTKN